MAHLRIGREHRGGNTILGNPSQWFDPNAFLQPPANSGFFGNLTRNNLTGPGLATWDLSAIKNTTIHERLSLQFRAEVFNLLNRANFNTPSLIVFTPTGVSGKAGAITSTSTTARQVQFGLKLLWVGSWAQSFWSITSVDLITTLTASPFFERHSLGASTGDHALDEVLPHAHHNVCHYTAKLYFLDSTG